MIKGVYGSGEVLFKVLPQNLTEKNSGKRPDTSVRTAGFGTTIRNPAFLSVAIIALPDKTN